MLRRLVFWNFRYLYSADQWVRQRLSPAGRLLVAALVASAVFGVNTRETQTYQLFAVLLALLAVAVATRLFARPRVEARRLLPQFATAGEPLTYRVRLRNPGRRKLYGLCLFEVFDFSLPTFEELYGAREPGEERRNWFDRTVGYPRWLWLIATRRGAEVVEHTVPAIGPSDTVAVDLPLKPVRRGYIHFSGIAVAQSDPLGLARSVARVSQTQSLLVLPRRYPVPRLRLPGRRHHQPGGVAQASTVGESPEFFSVRDYRPGDPWRHIHWRSWAKRGRPVVKEFREEFMVRYALLLDTFAADGQDDLFEEAVSVAASVVCGRRQPDALLDLVLVGPTRQPLTAGRGLAVIEHLLEVLACVTPTRNGDPRDLQTAIRAHADSLSACVCVLLAWDSARQGVIALLKALAVPVRVLVVTRGDEPLEPGPMADEPHELHALPAGRIAEALARL